MPIIAKKTGEEFERLTNGTYQAVCIGVYDIGLETYVYQGKETTNHKVIVLWEVDERITQKGEYEGKRFMMSKKYTLSLNEKANLRKDLESWRGREFSVDELEGFDVETIVGANCLITAVAKESNGKTYTNIQTVSALPKNMPKITRESEVGFVPEWILKLQGKEIPVASEEDRGFDISGSELDDPYKEDKNIPF